MEPTNGNITWKSCGAKERVMVAKKHVKTHQPASAYTLKPIKKVHKEAREIAEKPMGCVGKSEGAQEAMEGGLQMAMASEDAGI